MNSAESQLLLAFRSCNLPSLSHEEHVRLAWMVSKDQPLLPALETLRQGLRAFAQAKGKPEIFHETITWAFTVMIHERIERGRDGAPWQEFISLNPDLCRGLVGLEHYYHRETLESDLARRTFLLPDRVCQTTAGPAAHR